MICTKCGLEKLGSNGRCLPCSNARQRELRSLHPERYRSYDITRRARNPEGLRLRDRKRRINTPEHMKARDKAWRESHREERTYHARNWRKNNFDRIYFKNVLRRYGLTQ